jgi:hypothetical protein
VRFCLEAGEGLAAWIRSPARPLTSTGQIARAVSQAGAHAGTAQRYFGEASGARMKRRSPPVFNDPSRTPICGAGPTRRPKVMSSSPGTGTGRCHGQRASAQRTPVGRASVVGRQRRVTLHHAPGACHVAPRRNDTPDTPVTPVGNPQLDRFGSVAFSADTTTCAPLTRLAGGDSRLDRYQRILARGRAGRLADAGAQDDDPLARTRPSVQHHPPSTAWPREVLPPGGATGWRRRSSSSSLSPRPPRAVPQPPSSWRSTAAWTPTVAGHFLELSPPGSHRP